MHNPPPSPPPRRIPTSAITAFIQRDAINELLRPWLPADDERALVVRCLLDTGPAHHCGANYVLLRLLGLVLERVGGPPASGAADDSSVAIPLRLPPPFADARQEVHFPLTLPTRAVAQLAPRNSRHFAAMVDCLTDGPPQHALANAAILRLIEAVLMQLGLNLQETP